ncbi:2-amino-4-hydroxy-6-hydroxymethyldihydropteridine pyrophosphokinase FolK [Legionella drancourtii LLAP12]|uniref:2-amino-4-hydroxy-6-hydroxymethyldihydropteridine pyrophosphokinase n=1 Tax=Legionella drancourtii LLAP12 TaxID=658187 RepID=G9ERK3_9GAMM|nr:2-amino-4-hydroxy-6-hydroxymethyldihydropteridine pyrophosphokinase FolK [Legionella drancourtii LLAP12]
MKLLQACQKIEKQQGRVRKKRWGPRIIDIDILLYGKQHIHLRDLTTPHPHILSRDFVLVPLKEINPSIEKKLVVGCRTARSKTPSKMIYWA